MGFCTNCGQQIEPNHAFCTNCGQAVPVAGAQPSVQPVAPAIERPLPLAAAGAVIGGVPAPLRTASLSVLGLLFGFLAAIVLLALYSMQLVSAPLVIVLTILINVAIWAVGPWFSDFMYRIFYGVRFYTPQELLAERPAFAKFVAELCRRQNLVMPKIGLIDDDNPTAFTYGSNTKNARIIVTKGLWTYLHEDEIDAVVAHEIGHIVHRDFIVMAIANTVLQLLYEIYYMTNRNSRSSSSNNSSDSGRLALIGILAFVFYQVGYYLVLFLSRIRESYADEFAAKATGNPNLLSTALVKIAYGIVAKDESEDSSSTRLLQSTKTLGIMGFRSAQQAGAIAKATQMESTGIGRACLYDLVSPWAKISELASTHPLTGKRLGRLEKLATSMGQTPVYPISQIQRTEPVDKQRLWSGFWTGLTLNYLPVVLLIVSFVLLMLAVSGTGSGGGYIFAYATIGCLFLMSLSLFGRAFYRYPKITDAAPTTVLEQMGNVYASPIKGTPVHMQGNIIGRGDAGFVAGEDVILRDNTGLIYLNYTSPWGFIGNLFFGWRKVKQLIGQPVAAEGWFYRSFSQQVVLRRMQPQNGKLINSYARFWTFFGAWFMLIISTAAVVVTVMLAGSTAP